MARGEARNRTLATAGRWLQLAASPAGSAAALAAAGLAVWGWVFWLRRFFGYGPWRPLGCWPPGFDAYALGQAVQEWIVPVALVGLLGAWPLFRRAALGRGGWRERALATLALALVQLVSFAYLWALERRDVGHVSNGELLVVFAGFLLGPAAGLALGLLTALAAGFVNLISYPPDTFIFGDTLRWYFFYNTNTAALVWLGPAAGWLGRLGGRGNLALWSLGGGALVALARFFVLYGESDPGELVGLVFPLALAAAALMSGLGLILRSLRLQEAERRAREGELALTRAELASLRAQINPHFLFNALNTIRYFVRTDPEKARELLLRLSEVFQRALRSGEFVSLADEIAYAEAYLALEQARMGERLRVEWVRPDGELLEVRVPALVLEPLVENAVVHGLAPKPEGGTLRVLIERWGRELVIQVRDDGVGFDAGGGGGHGIALANIDERLRLLYGDDHGLRVESEPGRGTRVELRLPLPGGRAEEE
ncbi:sensor histidine kinase [Oceanithermus sp.]